MTFYSVTCLSSVYINSICCTNVSVANALFIDPLQAERDFPYLIRNLKQNFYSVRRLSERFTIFQECSWLGSIKYSCL